MGERKWKLGDDLIWSDNLLDGVTFQDLLLAVYCDCPLVTQECVRKELDEIISERLEDMKGLLERNIDAIVAEAKKWREDK